MNKDCASNVNLALTELNIFSLSISSLKDYKDLNMFPKKENLKRISKRNKKLVHVIVSKSSQQPASNPIMQKRFMARNLLFNPHIWHKKYLTPSHVSIRH